jgi:selenide,water dikinase
VLRHVKPSTDPHALVGTETSDDAAVYRLSENAAIVETVDFFTPVVDDPYWFGRIAAANAFSDVWAMGGRPLFALNIVAWPVGKLPMDQLGDVLRGGADTAALAGASILGGHSIDDPEPKYGLAVTGIVHPDRILRNVGARAGDRLLLTKPLGAGVATTAIKRGVAPLDLVERVVAQMAALNRTAGELLAGSGKVHALTDVTGFGLLGHAWEMARGSGVGVRLRAGAVPILEGVRPLAEAGVFPGGSKANLAWVAPHVAFEDAVDETTRLLLADAQTNGGLLAAVEAAAAPGLIAAMEKAGVAAVEVGEILPGEPARIEVLA